MSAQPRLGLGFFRATAPHRVIVPAGQEFMIEHVDRKPEILKPGEYVIPNSSRITKVGTIGSLEQK